MISEQRNRKRGAALVEFSLVATLLLLLAAGAGDFELVPVVVEG